MFRIVLYAAALITLVFPASAQTLLTVTRGDSSVEYDLAALQALPQTQYATENAFIDGKSVYSGPLLRDILELSDLLDEDEVSIRAINDYEIDFPVADAMNYNVIVATQVNGALMSVREKGPLWLMYPLSDHPELVESIYKSRMIWQMVDISSK